MIRETMDGNADDGIPEDQYISVMELLQGLLQRHTDNWCSLRRTNRLLERDFSLDLIDNLSFH